MLGDRHVSYTLLSNIPLMSMMLTCCQICFMKCLVDMGKVISYVTWLPKLSTFCWMLAVKVRKHDMLIDDKERER